MVGLTASILVRRPLRLEGRCLLSHSFTVCLFVHMFDLAPVSHLAPGPQPREFYCSRVTLGLQQRHVTDAPKPGLRGSRFDVQPLLWLHGESTSISQLKYAKYTPLDSNAKKAELQRIRSLFDVRNTGVLLAPTLTCLILEFPFASGMRSARLYATEHP